MKVKIVDKKEDVKEMTIEELAEDHHFGYQNRSGTGEKYHLINIPYSGMTTKTYIFINSFDNGLSGWWEKLEDILLNAADRGQLFVFKTDKLLYLWMAE